MIPNGYMEEQTRDGETVQCWSAETSYEHLELRLYRKDGELSLKHKDRDGHYCDLGLDLDVILELLRRAGFVVQEPEVKQ